LITWVDIFGGHDFDVGDGAKVIIVTINMACRMLYYSNWEASQPLGRKMIIRIYRASPEEQQRVMPADWIVPEPMYVDMRAITIRAPRERVWPWLAQLGSGRAGWYAYDWIDNGGRPSARSILPEHQSIAPGDVMPALPGAKDVFYVHEVEPPHHLVLTVPSPTFGNLVSWDFLLESRDPEETRLLVRGRISPHWLDNTGQSESAKPGQPIFIERVYGLLGRMPESWMIAVADFGHGLMETRMLHGIQQRAEARKA
jgi:uncharacterized protein YndB with AHSA1/START domain